MWLGCEDGRGSITGMDEIGGPRAGPVVGFGMAMGVSKRFRNASVAVSLLSWALRVFASPPSR